MAKIKNEKEIRSSKNYEIRALETEDGKRVITATIPYNSKSEYIQTEKRDFYEILKPGCFRKTINDGYNIRALYQHDESIILGAVNNGTLKITDTIDSLTAEITLPETTEARDIYNLIKDGYIQNCSFGFRPIKVDWSIESTGRETRTVTEAHLFEISPVTFPAYEMANVSVSLRSLSEFNVDVDALTNAIEEKDKDKIKSILSPLFTEPEKEKITEEQAAESPAVEDTGSDPTLYASELDLLLIM